MTTEDNMKGETSFAYEWDEKTKQLFIYPLVVSEEKECLVPDESGIIRIALSDEQEANDYARQFGRENGGWIQNLNPRVN